MQNYECTAIYEANSLQEDRFCAASLASRTPESKENRSSEMFLSQVECGSPRVSSPSYWFNPFTGAMCKSYERHCDFMVEKSGNCLAAYYKC